MKRTSSLPKLNREQILEASKCSDPQARFMVANYYLSQDMRKRTDMQLRHISEKDPKQLAYTAACFATIENDVKKMLTAYAEGHPVGRWMLAQYGVGPVIAAGLLANINIERCPTVGHIWRFAGQDPSCKWEKGEKRPWNPDMKQLVFHMGECFKRAGQSPDNFYGAIYRSRKALVVKRNDEGYNAERAKTFRTKSADVRKTLAEGKLPDGNLDRQACNYAAKIFLSHVHALLYWNHYKKAPPKPFAISILGHAHEIAIPQCSMFPGFSEAYYGRPAKAWESGRDKAAKSTAKKPARKAKAKAAELRA